MAKSSTSSSSYCHNFFIYDKYGEANFQSQLFIHQWKRRSNHRQSSILPLQRQQRQQRQPLLLLILLLFFFIFMSQLQPSTGYKVEDVWKNGGGGGEDSNINSNLGNSDVHVTRFSFRQNQNENQNHKNIISSSSSSMVPLLSSSCKHCITSPIIILTQIRGGANDFPQRNEHEEWLYQQQQLQQQQQYFESSSPIVANQGQFYNNNYNTKSSSPIHLRQTIQRSLASVYHTTRKQSSSPMVATTIASLLIFLGWHLPHYYFFSLPQTLRRGNGNSNGKRKMVQLWSTFFVNCIANTRTTLGLSLILSCVSHISFSHLLMNLWTFWMFGLPQQQKLQQQKLQQQQRLVLPISTKQETSFSQYKPFWSLLISSAIFSNLFFLILTKAKSPSTSTSTSLGLSGVIMTLVAIQCQTHPNRVYRISFLYGLFPIALSARQILHALFAWSIFGYALQWIASSSSSSSLFFVSNIAHLAHLGGLIYGLWYYDSRILQRSFQESYKSLYRYLQLLLSSKR